MKFTANQYIYLKEDGTICLPVNFRDYDCSAYLGGIQDYLYKNHRHLQLTLDMTKTGIPL